MSDEQALLLPDVEEPMAKPYWDAARKHKLVMQHCHQCGHVRWPPRSLCPLCLADAREDEWQEVAPTGTVWSFVVYHRAFRPEFAGKVPYNVTLVKLDAGPVVTSNVVSTNELKIGQKVTAIFDDIAKNITLVKFDVVIP